ncbi:MAG: hypothetical protein ACJA06_000012 [Halocynthiibacter sp.]|jgi:hypothetical protein
MNDPFKNRTPSLSGPETDIRPVTPADGVELSDVALALYVETGGAIAFVTAAGQARIVQVADFSILPVGAREVSATGTTASGIHAMVLA